MAGCPLASSPGPTCEERAWYPLLAHAWNFIGMSINRVFSVYFRVTLNNLRRVGGVSPVAMAKYSGSADNGEFDRALHYTLQLQASRQSPSKEKLYTQFTKVEMSLCGCPTGLANLSATRFCRS